MIKRLQITLLALFVSVWAMASYTSVKNADGVEIWYDFDSNTKTASVTYKGEAYYTYYVEYIGNVVIPSKVTYEGEEYSVTKIGDYAFYDCSSLTSITIPEGVTSIGKYAFLYCSSLTSIGVALDNNSYTSINGILFSKDKTILIKYPEGKKDVTSYEIPKGVTKIGNSAFRNCSSLTSITIPKSVTSIEDDAFRFCSSLTSITIPEGVTEIEDYAFAGCCKLYEVYNKSNLTITAGSSDNGYVAYHAKKVYTDDSGESKLHTVGDYIFYVDEDNIELLAYIGDEIAITLPSDYEGKNYKIGNYAFYDCHSLTSITTPKGVTEIGKEAFSNCKSLTSITIPEGVTEIGQFAFDDCSSLTSIMIPEGVTEIASGAFRGCISLTSITIPKGVTSIGGVAFSGCHKLYEVYNKSNLTIRAGSKENGDVARYAKKVYTEESRESKLHTVGDYIFYVDKDNIELLVYLGDETAITLPSDYEGKNYKIGDYAFFYDCRSLTSITIPESVTEIGESAFEHCRSLTSITIPEGLTKIGSFAFRFCRSLTSITSLNVTPPSIWDSSTFSNVDKSIPVYVPKQSVEAYKSAKYWKDFTNIVGKFLVVTATAENGTVTGAGVYEENAEVTLIATPDESYTFVKWSDGNTNATRKITVKADATYTATFAINQHTLTVTSNGNGTVSGGGTYDYGTKVTLKATAEDNYHFVKWSDGNTNATREVTVEADATYTATFAINQHTLTVTSNGNGTVSGGGTYDYGTKVTIKATADDNYHFVKWGDGNTNATHEVTVEADATYTATFAVDQYTISVSTDGNGTVSGAGSYGYGSTATLVATPKTGYYFAGWSDGETNATREVIVTEDVTLTAVFESNSSVTPITDVVADSVSIRLIGNSLIVEGAESYAVYALSGQCLGKVESLERGVYIVVADGVSKKIVVK